MEVEVVVQPPGVPSKWDIIPIHSSDVASYKQCRRKWDWSSPARNNLRRKVSIHGIYEPFWFGSGIHYALEMFYDPVLKRDPVEAFLTWYDIQTRGGIVTEDWLERVYDLHPVPTGQYEVDATLNLAIPVENAQPLYKIKGLFELLPQPIEEEFEVLRQLGVGMMEYYKGYAAKHDDFIVVARESTYSIPLGFESLDVREDSPNHGRYLEVHARGKRDTVVYVPETQKYRLHDYKTAAKIDEDYFIKFEKDEQFSNYLWATKYEALQAGYPWSEHVVDSIVCVALRKNYPKPPTVLQSGFLSIDRQKEGTTAELFQEAIIGNENLEHWFKTNEKAQNYYTYLLENGDDLFIQKDTVTRNAYEIEAVGKHLKMIAQEMLDPNTNIYPNPTGSRSCTRCAFRPPCIAKDDGSDWQTMLVDGFEENRDR